MRLVILFGVLILAAFETPVAAAAENSLDVFYRETRLYFAKFHFGNLLVSENGREIDLDDCAMISYEAPSFAFSVEKPTISDLREIGLLDLARTASLMEHAMRQGGYGEEYWRSELARLEGKAKRSILTARSLKDDSDALKRAVFDRKALAAAANRDPRVKSRKLPKAIVWGECAPDFYSVRLKSKHAGDILLITEFEYRVCKAQGLDPEDVDRCDRWVYYAQGDEHSIAGLFRYKFEDSPRSKAKNLNLDDYYRANYRKMGADSTFDLSLN